MSFSARLNKIEMHRRTKRGRLFMRFDHHEGDTDGLAQHQAACAAKRMMGFDVFSIVVEHVREALQPSREA